MVSGVRLSGALVRRRGRVLLGPLDLDLGNTPVTVILGPNGAGKSTLLRVLHGLEHLNAGTLETGDVGTEGQAFVFQTPVILRRSVRGNLAYPLALRDTLGSAARVADWAARTGLEALLDAPAARLSGGEQQKMSLARALITAPDLLFLDEPTSNLDGTATREIESLIQAAAANGTQVVLATHDLGQARRLAAAVVFLHRGQLIEQGPADRVFDAPQSAQLRAFLKGDIIE